MQQTTRRKCFHLVNLIGWNRPSSVGHDHFPLLLPRYACIMSSSKRQRTAAHDDDNDPSISPPPVKRKVQSTVTSRRPSSPLSGWPMLPATELV